MEPNKRKASALSGEGCSDDDREPSSKRPKHQRYSSHAKPKSLKRKARSSDDDDIHEPARSSKRFRPYEETFRRGSTTTGTSPSSRQPSSEPTETVVTDSRMTSLAATSERTTKPAQQSLASDEIEFVIHARDNNLPDPFGTHSTTTRRLTYGEVAKLYNEKFGRNVGPAAVEKRYRTCISKYREKNPNYPANIVYTPKEAKPKRIPRKDSAVAFNQDVPEKELDGNPTKTQTRNDGPNEKTKVADDATKGTDSTEVDNQRYTTWPLDDAKFAEFKENSSDAGEKKPPSKPGHDIEISDEERPYWAHLTVETEDGMMNGSCAIPLRDLSASSQVYADYLKEFISVELSFMATKQQTLARYITMISPEVQRALPTCDFQLLRHKQPKVSKIQWSMRKTVDLYILAAQLQDCHVRNTIIDHWCRSLENEKEVEILLESIERLFMGTEESDPARNFWIDALHGQGLSDLVANASESVHSTLRHRMKRRIAREACRNPWTYKRSEFVERYHCGLQSPLKSSLNDTPHFEAIAARCLFVEDQRSKHDGAETDGSTDGEASSNRQRIAILAAEFERQYYSGFHCQPLPYLIDDNGDENDLGDNNNDHESYENNDSNEEDSDDEDEDDEDEED